MKKNELCRWCDLFLDGELDQRAESEFLSHLEQCPKCTDRIQRWESLKLELEAACRLFGPSSEDVQVSPVLPDSAFGSRREQTFSRRLVLGLCAVILIGLGMGLWLASQWNPTRSANGSIEPTDHKEIKTVISEQTKPTKPVVTVDIKAPAIASSAFSSSRFTVVQVYPVFQERE